MSNTIEQASIDAATTQNEIKKLLDEFHKKYPKLALEAESTPVIMENASEKILILNATKVKIVFI